MSSQNRLADAVMKNPRVWRKIVDPNGWMGNSIGLAQQMDILYAELDNMSDEEKRQLEKRLRRDSDWYVSTRITPLPPLKKGGSNILQKRS